MVTDQLAVHEVTRSISVPVNVRVEGNTLSATEPFPVRPADCRVTPISVRGVVLLNDAVNSSSTIAGR